MAFSDGLSLKKAQFNILGIAIIILVLIAIFGKYIAPHDPYLVDMSNSLRPPDHEYWLGCDNLGRCILSRILYGASASIFSAFIIIAVISSVGSAIGIIAAIKGGITEKILMKINVIFQAFPDFILAMAIAGMLGTGLRNGMISLCFVCWTKYARLSRSLALEIKDADYLRSAVISGANSIQIMFKHIIPNIISQLFIMAALDVSGIILSLAGLSFLGLSAQHPAAEWGMMMSDCRQYLQIAPWTVIFPGIALFIVVIVFNLFADTFRDLLDAKGTKTKI